MITHNGTYLIHATHHGMPIYAATMGGKMVIGGKWLLSATLQAIVDAFGSAEGTEVIAKTNDYLNRIATTDPQRAQRLSGFINEDPLLVCSLVETSKTRWLVTDGLACIQTQTILDGHSNITSYCKVPANIAGNQALWCARETTNANTYTSFLLDSSIRADYGSTQTTTGRDMPRGKDTKLQSIDGCFYLNGEKLTNREFVSFSTVNGVSLFASYSTGGAAPYTNVQNGFMQGAFIVEQEGEQVANICPFIRNSENGMLDIISGTFYPNANTEGSFTIALTDKTTS